MFIISSVCLQYSVTKPQIPFLTFKTLQILIYLMVFDSVINSLFQEIQSIYLFLFDRFIPSSIPLPILPLPSRCLACLLSSILPKCSSSPASSTGFQGELQPMLTSTSSYRPSSDVQFVLKQKICLHLGFGHAQVCGYTVGHFGEEKLTQRSR